jgi:GNAT superfamily N-acetyltransferase
MSEHHITPPQERWPLLEAVTTAEMLSYLGTSPLAEKYVSDEIQWVITGVEDNTFNGVVRAQLSEANADRIIDEVGQRFRERGAWHLWPLDPKARRPADLAQRLVDHGWRPLAEGVMMAIDLSAIAGPFPSPPGLTIKRVVDEAGIAVWGEFHRYLGENQDQRDEPRERLYISLGLDGDQPLRHYVAWIDAEPVGALSLFLGQEAAGIYNVNVAPSKWRQGIGTAMTRAMLEEARRVGYGVAVLGPTPESRPMYERLGFVLHSEPMAYYWYPLKSE